MEGVWQALLFLIRFELFRPKSFAVVLSASIRSVHKTRSASTMQQAQDTWRKVWDVQALANDHPAIVGRFFSEK